MDDTRGSNESELENSVKDENSKSPSGSDAYDWALVCQSASRAFFLLTCTAAHWWDMAI